MIILDTDIWIWYVQDDKKLKPNTLQLISDHETAGLGVSAISLWEIAEAVENGGLSLPLPVTDWLEAAILYPGIELLPLTPKIAALSANLPGNFHKDPADQIIVATSLVHSVSLVTYDSKITSYPHIRLLT